MRSAIAFQLTLYVTNMTNRTMKLPEATDLGVLLERIGHVPKLREHHVWEATRCLGIHDLPKRFTVLIEADAMLDAAMLMVALSQPRRVVTGLRYTREHWRCDVQATALPSRRRPRSFTAEHADAAAATLSALISSHLKFHQKSGHETVFRSGKDWRLHHET
jgi:hypothetical protein